MNYADCLCKVVAADHVLVHRPKLWNHPHGFTRHVAPAARLNKSSQDCQRQHMVTCVHGIIDFHRQIRLPRQRADPFATFANIGARRTICAVPARNGRRRIHTFPPRDLDGGET